MDFNKILTGLIGKTLKMPDGEIAELLKDGDGADETTILATLLEKDAARISKLNGKEKFQEGYKKAKAEERKAQEAEIKDAFEIESDLEGLDLIKHIIDTKAGTGEGGGKKKELTDDDIKKHSVYQSLESAMKKALKEKETEWSNKYNEREAEFNKGKTFDRVKEKALTQLDSLKPVLPSNPSIAANQKNWFVNAFKDYDYEFQGDRVVVMKDGKVLENEHGHSVEFDDLVQTIASGSFEFQQNNGGSNAGNSNDGDKSKQTGNQGDYPAGITKPKTLDELSKLTNDDKIPVQDRQTILKTWEAENGNGV